MCANVKNMALRLLVILLFYCQVLMCLRLLGHVFHTSQQAIYKTYIMYGLWLMSGLIIFYHRYLNKFTMATGVIMAIALAAAMAMAVAMAVMAVAMVVVVAMAIIVAVAMTIVVVALAVVVAMAVAVTIALAGVRVRGRFWDQGQSRGRNRSGFRSRRRNQGWGWSWVRVWVWYGGGVGDGMGVEVGVQVLVRAQMGAEARHGARAGAGLEGGVRTRVRGWEGVRVGVKVRVRLACWAWENGMHSNNAASDESWVINREWALPQSDQFNSEVYPGLLNTYVGRQRYVWSVHGCLQHLWTVGQDHFFTFHSIRIAGGSHMYTISTTGI